MLSLYASICAYNALKSPIITANTAVFYTIMAVIVHDYATFTTLLQAPKCATNVPVLPRKRPVLVEK